MHRNLRLRRTVMWFSDRWPLSRGNARSTAPALLVNSLPLRRAIEAVIPGAASFVPRVQVDHGGWPR